MKTSACLGAFKVRTWWAGLAWGCEDDRQPGGRAEGGCRRAVYNSAGISQMGGVQWQEEP